MCEKAVVKNKDIGDKPLPKRKKETDKQTNWETGNRKIYWQSDKQLSKKTKQFDDYKESLQQNTITII